MAWNGFVDMVPARVVFALGLLVDNTDHLDHLELDGKKKKPENIHAAKGETLRKLFGLDGRGLLKSVQGDRSFRGLSSLFKGRSNDMPPGLGNWDNSCYQNSVIQGWASLSSFTEYLSQTTSEYSSLSKDTTNGALLDTITKLNDPGNYGKRLWTPDKLKSMSSSTQQDAQEYYSKILDELDKEIYKASQESSGSTTSGLLAAKGLLRNPMVALENSKLRVERDQSAKNGILMLASTTLRNPLDGLLAQRVGCIHCGFSEGLSMTPFNCLTVPLGRGNIYDVRDCLSKYTELELIDGVECAKCTLLQTKDNLLSLLDKSPAVGPAMLETLRNTIATRFQVVKEALDDDDFADATLIKKCKIPKKNWVASTKSKQFAIARAPKSLVIHVNRSVFDEFSGTLRKNSASVRFPQDLDLGPWCLGSQSLHSQDMPEESTEEWSKDPIRSMLPDSAEEGFLEPSPLRYMLRAVVTHYGQHENGHYICYRKHSLARAEPGSGETLQDDTEEKLESAERWWRLSDEDVSMVSEADVLNQGGVFMLFYERDDGKPKPVRIIEQRPDLVTDTSSSAITLPPTTSANRMPEASLHEIDPADVPLPDGDDEDFEFPQVEIAQVAFPHAAFPEAAYPQAAFLDGVNPAEIPRPFENKDRDDFTSPPETPIQPQPQPSQVNSPDSLNPTLNFTPTKSLRVPISQSLSALKPSTQFIDPDDEPLLCAPQANITTTDPITTEADIPNPSDSEDTPSTHLTSDEEVDSEADLPHMQRTPAAVAGPRMMRTAGTGSSAGGMGGRKSIGNLRMVAAT